MDFSSKLSDNMSYLKEKLNVDTNFDVVYRAIHVGGREACLYFIDGFTKDEVWLKILQAFSTAEGRLHAGRRSRIFQEIPSLRRGWTGKE